MAAFLDVCRFNPTAGGTTDWTFSSAVTGYQSPTAASAVNGTVYRYRAESADLSQWEIGFGAYNSGTGVFARTTVLFNSLGTTAKVSFSAAPQVAIVALAEDVPSLTAAFNAFTGAMSIAGNTGVGTAAPRGLFDVTDAGGANTSGDVITEAVITGASTNPFGTASGLLFLQSNTAMAADKGASIAFGGRFKTASTDSAFFSGIFGAKENGTTNDLAGYLSLLIRNAAGAVSEALRISSLGDALFSGKVVSSGATAGIGYTTGAGGTVAQATSKATGVTLNKASGTITMNAAALAAATIVSFVLTDSAIAATDVLVLNHISTGTPGSYSLNARCATGSATIDVRNNTAGSLSEAIVIQFALIKATNA